MNPSRTSKTLLRKPTAPVHQPDTHAQNFSNPQQTYRRAMQAPDRLTPADVSHLQSTVGNRAVQRMLAQSRQPAPDPAAEAVSQPGPELRLGPTRDRYESEASAVADHVTNSLNGTAPQQASPAAPSIQRMAHDTGSSLDPGIAQEIQQTRGGKSLDGTIRRKMESQFGTSFGNVRLHTDSRADTLNRSLDARAFTKGRDIFFRSGEYNPGTQQGQHLLAHELTHIVQQSQGTVQREVIQRVPTVDTDGGTWKANVYQVVPDGAEIELEFAPNDTVNATKIGLIQTSLKVERGKNFDTQARADYESGAFQMPAQKRKAQRSDGVRHIDRDVRMNNPIYGAPDLANGQSISATPKGKLDMSAKAQRNGTAQNYQLGHRYKSLFGLKTNKRSAKLYDKPNLPGAVSALEKDRNAKSNMTFETTAVALSGSQAGRYYGSVQWGFKIDDPDTGVELLDFTKKSDGNPSPEMQGVITNWNAGEFDDGMANPQIPVPPAT
jgi:hypothetical protein